MQEAKIEEQLEADLVSNEIFFQSTAQIETSQLEIALHQRISHIEETLQSQRERLTELETECEQAETAGDDNLYALLEAKWEQVEENVGILETAKEELSRI